jgi:hypothetical protein
MCGGFRVVNGRSLKTGDIKSCGCIKKKREHSPIYNRLYSIWKNMKTRCYSKNKGDYHRYGGRGIKVCSVWNEDFGLFAKWALEAGYADNLTLDRKNNDGNYCPDNCRWVTRRQQSNNMSSNHTITAKGRTQSIADWGRDIGVNPQIIYDKIRKSSRTDEQAVMSVM